MTDDNIIRKAMRDAGIEPTPREQWTDDQKIEMDRILYGTGVGRLWPDGTLEHIPVRELIFRRTHP